MTDWPWEQKMQIYLNRKNALNYINPIFTTVTCDMELTSHFFNSVFIFIFNKISFNIIV